MPRLRITATLSLLALAIGAAGTQWLSEQTAGTAKPPETGPRVASARPVHRAHPKPAVTVARPHYYVSTPSEAAAAPTASTDAAATLVPISTPSSSLPTSRMEHHATGNVVLHLTIDGQGAVTAATVARSSGDDVLDTNAMEIARHWRFAVPADHPQGISGDLPMRFAGVAALRVE